MNSFIWQDCQICLSKMMFYVLMCVLIENLYAETMKDNFSLCLMSKILITSVAYALKINNTKLSALKLDKFAKNPITNVISPFKTSDGL